MLSIPNSKTIAWFISNFNQKIDQLRTYKKWLDGFERRYQLVIRNIENFAEYATTPFSGATLIIFVFSFFFASFGCSLWLAKTVLAKWVNPTYLEKENKKKILTLLDTVETLEKQIHTQSVFIETLQQIIKGNPVPSSLPLQPPASSVPSTLPTRPTILNAPAIISPKKKGTLPPFAQHTSTTAMQDSLLIPPMNGMISAPFNMKNGHYGVDIVAKEKDPIKAVAAGIVIFSDWSVDSGWIIVIQHFNNLVSIYKHCAVLFKKVGNLIKVGDIIALMGNSGELSTNPHLHFELWYESAALNPEDFYNF
ncbi:M23 family metallopeptidase [Candidatus Cardinium hertigii]|uniref:M23 family metallopeptidase n=1 Tax=Candidatus Cardinium hertigii TaxID=247481 RepID=UPI00194F32C7|nr:M23 family metallopeptidase [Candidatus Cardinium hertigii]